MDLSSEWRAAATRWGRLPDGAGRFLLTQLAMPSFQTCGRRDPCENDLAALLLAKPA
jgi:hypothetical protein